MRNSVGPSGTYNVICDRCGFKFKNHQLQKEWTGAMVCHGPGTNDCWEPRHPQEFIKAIPDNKQLPFTRTDADAPLTYTPTWGLINSLGNGTVTGEYTEYTEADGDKIVNVHVRAVMGSTTTFTAGTWTISVPVANGGTAGTGEAFVLVKGVRQIFGDVTLPASSSTCTIRTKGVATQWSNTVPATWSEADRFQMSIRYGTDT